MVRPVMRRFTSMQSRFFATLVAAAIATAPLHVALADPTVEELYTQGQEKFDAGDYGDAGDLWGQAVRLLPENEDNSATRQTIMNLALDAYLRAYRADEDDRSHIDDAKALLDEYEAALEGTGVELGAEIASEKGKIEDILAELEAEAEAAAAAASQQPEEEPPEDTNTEPLPVGNDRPGQGLVIGGTAMLGVGAVGIALMLGGVIGGLRAQTAFDTADDALDKENARKRGTTMNALAITGGVVAPIFIGAGVALVIIGLRKNKAARNGAMLLPQAGPNYVGLGIHGHF